MYISVVKSKKNPAIIPPGPPFMVLLLFFSVDREVWRCVANFIRFTGMLAQGLMLGRAAWRLSEFSVKKMGEGKARLERL